MVLEWYRLGVWTFWFRCEKSPPAGGEENRSREGVRTEEEKLIGAIVGAPPKAPEMS